MALPPTLDPATFANLVNTLGPAGALSQLEAQQVEQQKQLQQATTQATQEASQAGQQYQQAAAAPVQQVSPLDQFLPTLLGGIASVVSRDPSFRQHAEQEIAGKHRDLMQQRLDNLAALKDAWDKKAGIAERTGDLEANIKARQTSEKLAKLSQEMLMGQQAKNATDLENLRQKGDIASIRARGEEERKTQALAPPKHVPLADQPIDVKKFIRTSYGGRQYGDLGGVSGDVGNLIRIKLRESGIPVPDPAGSAGVTDVARAQKDLDKLQKKVLTLVPRDPQGRILGYANRKISKLAQTDPARAAFMTWSDAAIPVLRATAGSKNLRITQEQVKLAIKNLPTSDDTWSTVEDKLATLRTLLGNAESSLLDADLSPGNNTDPLGIL